MFDDEDMPRKKELFTPPALDDFSVDELKEYKQLLMDEVARVDQDIKRKSSYQDELNQFFKS